MFLCGGAPACRVIYAFVCMSAQMINIDLVGCGYKHYCVTLRVKLVNALQVPLE